MKIRIERVNSELKRQISRIIATELKDPRLGDGIIGVTRVDTTPDLKYAKVYLSIYADDPAARKSALDTVIRSKSFIRNALKDSMSVRLLPELNFLLDTSAEYGIKIDGILSSIEIPPADDEN